MRRVVIVFAPRPATTRWITEELLGEPYKVVAVPSMAALVSRLAERADQIAIIDFDAIGDEDIAALAEIRDTTWTGELIALGRVEFEVRKLLRVREMFMRPLGSERLRTSLSNITVSPPLPISSAEETAETSPHR
ncbi:MAG TPA: hypothetical protein VIV40_14750 [Kofleriaceae bacterium]